MISLPKSLHAWSSTAEFSAQLKQELEQLRADQLPLQAGLSLSSYVSSEPFKVMVIASSDDATSINAKVGIFYTGIIAGCSCSDDPSPTDVQPEYCELLLVIDKASAATSVSLAG